jgi:septal ring factor EnvC (AmiA/AmiB activator)
MQGKWLLPLVLVSRSTRSCRMHINTLDNDVELVCMALLCSLEKMDEAKVDVGRMKQNLAIKNQELTKASKETEALLKSISESTAIAEKEKNKVAVIVQTVSTKAAEISAVKAACEKDLAAAQPALDAV